MKILPEQSAYLRAAVDIGHLGSRVEDEGTLLEAVADLFQHNFGLVAVQVYVIDPSGLFGDLRHHMGEGDRREISRTPGVPVGVGHGLAQVLAGGAARKIEDMRTVPRSAMPPSAKSALALPLNVEGQVLGAIMLYAAERGSFSTEDKQPFVALTDMLALALENVRVRAQSRREVGRATASESVVAYSQPSLDLGRQISYTLGDEDRSQAGVGHTAPIKLRGSVVGALSFQGAGERELEPDEVELIDSVADQVAQAIENLNLLGGAQRVAQREQLINAITAQLQRATSVDEVLRTAAQAVRAALGNVEVTARLSPDAVVSPAQAELPAEGDEAE
jgi:GAF domain-containing protein